MAKEKKVKKEPRVKAEAVAADHPASPPAAKTAHAAETPKKSKKKSEATPPPPVATTPTPADSTIKKSKKRKAAEEPAESASPAVEVLPETTETLSKKSKKRKASADGDDVASPPPPPPPDVSAEVLAAAEKELADEEATPKVKDRSKKPRKRKLAEGETATDPVLTEGAAAAAAAAAADVNNTPPAARPQKVKKVRKPRAKPTAVQKLKLRESLRAKRIAVDSSVLAAASTTTTTTAASPPTDSEPTTPDAAPPSTTTTTTTANKKPIRADLLQTPKSAPGEAKRRQAAVEYLDCWLNRRNEWKFQKVRQVWILRNLWYAHQLDDAQFETALAYAKDLSHQARQETIEEAREIVRMADPDVGTVKKGVVEGNKIKFINDSDDEEEEDENEEEKVAEKTAEPAGDDAPSGEQKAPLVNPLIVSRAKKMIAALKTFF
ncbi:hypothetical protein HDU87_004623 [Geranomyces variabilis]|uniref:WKF domain-containing protein n=1 Tax=Geranomyces variabilis TaxID=109894 RepID=A0AAD5TJS0_9FUNG|nr:hypothetical protein HDU87_004623 [Geranomyces variabilis]